MFRGAIHTLAFVFFTVLTQVGGVAYALAVLMQRRSTRSRSARSVIGITIFAVGYIVLSTLAARTAPQFGRHPLPCFAAPQRTLVVQSPIYCALNRHYVREDLRDVALQLATHMANEFPGTVTLALDANFPFFDGFPLLPHLSHDDGRKLDLAFYYRSTTGNYAPGRTRSPIGYWAFENSGTGASDPCAGRNDTLTMRWDMAWFQTFVGRESLDEVRTRAMLQWLANEGARSGIAKVFIEPHLKRRLNVAGPIFRFQGCRAARHDDHVHIQISP